MPNTRPWTAVTVPHLVRGHRTVTGSVVSAAAVAGAAQGDVDEQSAHDGDAGPHRLLPAVDEGLLGGVDQALRVRACADGHLDGVGDAFPGRVRGVDLVVIVNGTEYVLAVLQDFPGRRLVVFTDETNGNETPAIGRRLVLPLLEPGSTLPVDFDTATVWHNDGEGEQNIEG